MRLIPKTSSFEPRGVSVHSFILNEDALAKTTLNLPPYMLRVDSFHLSIDVLIWGS